MKFCTLNLFVCHIERLTVLFSFVVLKVKWVREQSCVSSCHTSRFDRQYNLAIAYNRSFVYCVVQSKRTEPKQNSIYTTKRSFVFPVQIFGVFYVVLIMELFIRNAERTECFDSPVAYLIAKWSRNVCMIICHGARGQCHVDFSIGNIFSRVNSEFMCRLSLSNSNDTNIFARFKGIGKKVFIISH